MYQKQAGAYQQNQILTSSPEQVVPLLYEHLLVNLKRGRLQIEKRELEGKAESLGRAQEIILELLGALDRERGGELAERLSALYAYFLKEVSESSRTLDAPRLEPVITMVGELHEAWAAAARMVSEGGRD